MEIPSTFSVSDSISFEGAIELTQSLLAEVERHHVSEPELERIITALVQSENGARGFFVSYLTDDRDFIDQMQPTVVQALLNSEGTVGDLLTKNLVMSTAMILTHTRNQNPDMAASSARTRQRTAAIIRQMRSLKVDEHLMRMKSTIEQGGGDYQKFLDRWKYDAEQKAAMLDAIGYALLN
ncbi:hypothetical protein ACQ4M3_34825 [Leptolyngbya sp. AN03gr2]|uniref:hypothetical protein n=1 Tax=unclassified Leptolyngbya TaxID=2650499 RepID=UPI003D31175F